MFLSLKNSLGKSLLAKRLPPGIFNYLRPDGLSLYRQPDGTSLYKRPLTAGGDPENITAFTVATAGYTTQTLTYYGMANGKRAFRVYDPEQEAYHTILFGTGSVWNYYYAGVGYIRSSSDAPDYPWEATWSATMTFSDYVGGTP